jgi:hypothetical protein
MGTLKPGATYIYERVGNEVYAREAGADPSARQLIGYGYDPVSGHEIDYDKRTNDGRPLVDHIREDKLWGEIRRMARTNPTLQSELERVIMLYHLIKEESTTSHHPV